MKNQDKLAQRKRITFALLMGMITTVVISFTIVSINVGFTAVFLKVWVRSWLIAYLCVIPTILYVAPVVQHMVNRLFEEE